MPNTATNDPIFTAIARHRAARAALENIDELSEPARHAAAERKIFAAGEALFSTVPRTIAGAKALADFMLENARADGVEGRDLDRLKMLRYELDRLAELSAA